MRSKLSANKSDFERLKNLGTTPGAVGAALEKKVADQDKLIFKIVETKKEAHKGLIGIRDSMKCDIGKDQTPLKPDLSQVDQACALLDQKDKDLYKSLMPLKDKKEREYLAN